MSDIALAARHADAPVNVVTEPRAARVALIVVALAFLGLFLVMPLVVVFSEALRKGFTPYLASLADADALAAIRLTLTVAAIAVPLNVVFGIAAIDAPARRRAARARDRSDRSSSSSTSCSCSGSRSAPR